MNGFVSFMAEFFRDESSGILVNVWVFIFGACIGSFLNVCIWRIPRGESISRPASHCPKCNAPISWWQNIPLVSWVLLGGKCASCKERISVRYPFVEALCGALFLAAWAKYRNPEPLWMDPAGSMAVVPALWLAFAGLLAGSFIDIDHQYLPDRVTLGGIVAGLALSCAVPQLQHEEIWWRGGMFSSIGALAGGGSLWLLGAVFSKIFRREAMGFGDVKLIAAIGAFFGPAAVLFTIVVSSVIGSIAGIALLAAGKARLGGFREIPFGPYLAGGAVLWALWGPPAAAAYMDFAASLAAP